MRAFSLSHLQLEQWFASGVTTALTWPLLLAVYLAEQFGPPAQASGAEDAGPANDRAEADYLFHYVNHGFTHGYFGRYHW